MFRATDLAVCYCVVILLAIYEVFVTEEPPYEEVPFLEAIATGDFKSKWRAAPDYIESLS